MPGPLTHRRWEASANAGFTTGTPWIKVNPNYTNINSAQALSDPNSVFHYYQQLIRLHAQQPIIVYDRYDLILPGHPQIYAFTRTLQDDRLLVILNFSKDALVFVLPADITFDAKEPLIGNYAIGCIPPTANCSILMGGGEAFP